MSQTNTTAPSHPLPEGSPRVIPAESFAALLEAVQYIYPATRLAHIGVGQGGGQAERWRQWPIEEAWLAEPDAGRRKMAQSALEQSPTKPQLTHWSENVITAEDGPVTFYETRLPAATGLS